MKKSRRDRKMFNEGRQIGYLEGYKQGVYDGNPFNAFAEACVKLGENIRQVMTDPNVIQAISELQKTESEATND